MKLVKSWSVSLSALLLLAACGGGGSDGSDTGVVAQAQGDRRAFTSVVSFGDSLSDVGTYTPATLYPGSNPPFYLGGRFTTNSATSTIWIENVAARLGLVVTPAEVGFGTESVRCPAAANPALANTCTAYGQGGARVTDANGIRHTDPATGQLRALTVPIKTQIARHLQRFGRFTAQDLVFLWAGANDLLWEVETNPAVNPNSFVIKLFTIDAQAKAGLISPEQAQALLADAQRASQAAMKIAALEMAGYIRTEILAKGGRHVVVLNLPDPAVTPEGVETTAQSAVLGAALTSFADAFNQGLKEGLKGQPVVTIDIRRFISGVVAHPAMYRIVNATDRACSPSRIEALTGGTVADGFSLFCNATPDPRYYGLADNADVNTWFFADGNHPTIGGYRLISNEVLRQLRSLGWLRDQDREDWQ